MIEFDRRNLRGSVAQPRFLIVAAELPQSRVGSRRQGNQSQDLLSDRIQILRSLGNRVSDEWISNVVDASGLALGDAGRSEGRTCRRAAYNVAVGGGIKDGAGLNLAAQRIDEVHASYLNVARSAVHTRGRNDLAEVAVSFGCGRNRRGSAVY